jgi:hypothetical protein
LYANMTAWEIVSESTRFRYRAVTVSGGPSRPLHVGSAFVELRDGTTVPSKRSHDPACATPVGLARKRFGLIPFRSPLLGESLLLSVPRGTEMFQVPRLPLHKCSDAASPASGYPIRASPDRSLLAAPRSVTSCATPFLGSWPQGIRQPPCVA